MSTADREIVISRVFDAPPSQVFEAFTHARHVDHWWGPDGFTTHTESMEVRPGGTWLFTLKHPHYGVFRNRVRYLEIERGRRLHYLHDAGVDNDPGEFKVTITFEAQRDKTLVTMHSTFLTAAEVERVKGFGAVEAGKQTLAHLSEYLNRQAA